MRKYIILALALVAMVGCAKEDNLGAGSGSGDGEVQFSSSSIGSKLNDAGNEWIAGDSVGIFMYDYVKTAYTSSNVLYTADSDGSPTNFSVNDADETIYYPNGSDVSFRAYYPYVDGATAETISLDLSDQSNFADIDFMLADKVDVNWDSDNNSTDTPVALAFEHQLSKVIFNVGIKETWDDLRNITLTVGNISSTAEYTIEGVQSSVGNAGELLLATTYIASGRNPSSAVVEGIVLPTSASVSYTLLFDNGSTAATTVLNEKFEAGMQYEYTLELGNDYVYFEGCSIEPWKNGEENEDNDFYTEALGTKADPFLISSAEDLMNIGQGDYGLDSYYQLTQDIDLEGATWTPLADYMYPFSGTLDGAGFAIKNYVLDAGTEYYGLFSSVNGATFKDLDIEPTFNTTNLTSTTEQVGGLVGNIYGGTCTFSGCNVTSSFSSDDNLDKLNIIGGLVGNIAGNATVTISDCTVTSSSVIKGYYYVGGLVGINHGDLTIDNCTNYGDVSANYYYAGGLIGVNHGDLTIDNCTNYGNVSANYYAGGLIGSSDNSNTIISNCTNYGTIFSGNRYSGGIVGQVYSAKISDCVNRGTITANGSVIGGIAGTVGTSELNNCSNYANFDVEVAQVGGIAGSVSGSELNNCYNSGDIVSKSYYIGGLVGVLSASLSSIINDSTNEGSQVTGTYAVGGIVGQMTYSAEVNNCHNKANVTGNSSSSNNKTGGVVGNCIGYSSTRAKISNSSNSGKVEGAYRYVGGVVGEAQYLDMNDSYNTGEVTSSKGYVGGVVGDSESSNYSNCYNTATVDNATSSTYNTGGFVGRSRYDTITNSFNTGKVTSSGAYVGGFVGGITESINTISNCYNSGEVMGGLMTGGFAGYISGTGGVGSTFNTCYNVGSVSISVTTDYYGYFYGCSLDNDSYGYNSFTACYTATDGSSYTTQTSITEQSSDLMQGAGFVAELNAAAVAYNSAEPDTEACAWVAGSGSGKTYDDYAYPTLDFDNLPTANN